MKLLIAVVVSVVVGAVAVLVGVHLPERGRRFDVEARLARAEAELAAARSLILVHALHDRVLDLLEDAKDPASYEKAQVASTRFFDLVRQSAGGADSPELQAALTAVLARRDVVTGALARRDPTVRASLDEIRRALHPLLREPGAPAPTLAPPPPGR